MYDPFYNLFDVKAGAVKVRFLLYDLFALVCDNLCESDRSFALSSLLLGAFFAQLSSSFLTLLA